MWTLSPQGMGGPAHCPSPRPSPLPAAPPQRAAAPAPPTFTQPALGLIHPHGVWLPPSPQDISPLWCPLPTTHTRLTSVGKGDYHPPSPDISRSSGAPALRLSHSNSTGAVLCASHAPLPPLMTGRLRFREVNGSTRLVCWRLSWIQTMVWATPIPYILLLLALIGPSSWLRLSVVLQRGWTQRCKVRSFVARQAPPTLCPSCGCPTIPCPPALQYCTPACTPPYCKLYAFIFH